MDHSGNETGNAGDSTALSPHPLLALAERCEKAEGPNFELEQAIGCHVCPDRMQHTYAPNYTASLDAAMTLVPEGCAWNIYSDGPTYAASAEIGPHPVGGTVFSAKWASDGATPALALCAAALRGRSVPDALSSFGSSPQAVSPLRASIPSAVTQADRDAVADWAASIGDAAHNLYRRGRKDDHSLVQAFTRHRIAAQAELLEALRLADATLRGANMNRDVVERKVSAAIANHAPEIGL